MVVLRIVNRGLCHLTHIISPVSSLCRLRVGDPIRAIPSTQSSVFLLGGRNFSHSTPFLAGHSHWKNIKHTKGANDAKKAAIAVRIARDIRQAIKGPGGTNPSNNAELARVMAYARSENISSDTVERVLATAAANKSKPLEHATIECKGPAGALMLLELSSPQMVRTKQEIRGLFKKHVASIPDGGGILHSFDQKSMVTAKPAQGKTMDLGQAEEVAIEVGAEEVTEGDLPGEIVFVCDPMEAVKVSRALEKMGFRVTDSMTEYVPKTVIELSEEARTELNALIAKLEQHPDFVNIHLNCVT